MGMGFQTNMQTMIIQVIQKWLQWRTNNFVRTTASPFIINTHANMFGDNKPCYLHHINIKCYTKAIDNQIWFIKCKCM